MILTLPYPPSSNRYWRNFGGHTVISSEARAYKELVGWLVVEAGHGDILADPICLTLHVYRKRKAGDLDNRIKIILDALQGVVYMDDSQVTEIHAFRHDDKDNPRVEVEVSRA